MVQPPVSLGVKCPQAPSQSHGLLTSHLCGAVFPTGSTAHVPSPRPGRWYSWNVQLPTPVDEKAAQSPHLLFSLQVSSLRGTVPLSPSPSKVAVCCAHTPFLHLPGGRPSAPPLQVVHPAGPSSVMLPQGWYSPPRPLSGATVCRLPPPNIYQLGVPVPATPSPRGGPARPPRRLSPASHLPGKWRSRRNPRGRGRTSRWRWRRH